MAASTLVIMANTPEEANKKRKSLNVLANLSSEHLQKLEELARKPKAIEALDKKWGLIKTLI